MYVKVIYCGDFFQLPPVTETENSVPIPPTLAFESESWPGTVSKPIILKKVFRQTDSGTFKCKTLNCMSLLKENAAVELIDMLNALRIGELNGHHIRRFKELARPIVCPEGIEPIELCEISPHLTHTNDLYLFRYPLKKRVNDANNKRLAQLKGKAECFKSKDEPGLTRSGQPFPPGIVRAALKRMVALDNITLKVCGSSQ